MDMKAYISENRQRMLDELFDLLRIPSVSADPAYAGDVQKCAEAVADSLKQAGASNVEVMATPGHPIVYGEYIVDRSASTVLVYGHYDVQPADPIELWDNPAFEPIIKTTDIHPEGAIFARGSCDDKGQMFMHVKALEAMVASGEVPCNVKFIIEGEEEVGSDNLDDFLEEHKEKLAADVVLVSDTGIIANDTPSICVGLRGLAYVEVQITGPNRDLHSGLYGGAAPNPINILCEMIASLKDDDQRITVDGFYDDVLELSDSEREAMARAPFSEEAYKNSIGIGGTEGEPSYSPPERMSIRPTLDLNGIWGGYQGEGAKTVLPARAGAKFSCRRVPNQDPDKVRDSVQKMLEELLPPGLKMEVIHHHGAPGVVVSLDSPYMTAAAEAIGKGFGTKPVFIREGGSIPVVTAFRELLGIDTLLLGWGLDDDNTHSPNEKFSLDDYYRGTKASAHLWQEISKIIRG